MIRVDGGKRIIEVEEKEVVFLRQLLREHLEYYRILAGSEKASEVTRGKYVFLRGLMGKLS